MPLELKSKTVGCPAPRQAGRGDFWRVDLAVIACLLLIEGLCFFPLARKIGFYLDDWATFANLHFAPMTLTGLLDASLHDPRMVTRPFQCLYYAATYLCFGDNPFGYHAVRCLLEFLGGAFLYLAMRPLVGRWIAAATSLLFIVYPSHDSSHYWIGAGLGAGCGMTLYLLSLWLLVRSFRHGPVWYWLSVGAFGLSAFCYEAFLPMLSLSYLAVFWLGRDPCPKDEGGDLARKPAAEPSTTAVAASGLEGFSTTRPADLLRLAVKTLPAMVPFVLVALSEPLYQRFIAPKLAKVFLPPAAFNPQYFLDVFAGGISVSIGPEAWFFFAQSVAQTCCHFSRGQWLSLTVLTAACAVVLTLAQRSSPKLAPGAAVQLLAGAFVTLVCSYLTFAVAQGYTPTLLSILNRINMGASVPAALILAIAASLSAGRFEWIKVATVSLLIGFFCAVNWSYAPYWVQSWQVQRNVQEAVRTRAPCLSDGDCILLANAPRYVRWAPVFDGVWDFQSMIWLTLDSRDISGGVVSERLAFGNDGSLVDESSGYRCASYDLQRTSLLFPAPVDFIAPDSPRHFVELIRDRGMGFGLSPEALTRWEKQIELLESRAKPSPFSKD